MALYIMQWNCNGLRGHEDQLRNVLVNTGNTADPAAILCVEETFLNIHNQSPRLDGYNIIQKEQWKVWISHWHESGFKFYCTGYGESNKLRNSGYWNENRKW